MTERDFKLLIREVRQLQKKRALTTLEEEKLKQALSKLDKEIELFNQKEVNELPFN